MDKPKVTILVPNYKTPELTRLCLRLLRKYTDPALAHVIVIDNDSQDDSLNYLRKLSWIELIERPKVIGEPPAMAHANALDLALAHVTTPYVLSIHTDTLVKRPDWLPFLLNQIEQKPKVAGVGSWKLESKSWLQLGAKWLERKAQTVWRQWFASDHDKVQRQTDHYLRSHCALYRMDLVRQLRLTFADGEEVAGKVMHEKLVANGYQMLFLSSEELGQYVDHINHATMVLNPELGARSKTIKQGMQRLQQRLRAVNADEILQNVELDV